MNNLVDNYILRFLLDSLLFVTSYNKYRHLVCIFCKPQRQ